MLSSGKASFEPTKMSNADPADIFFGAELRSAWQRQVAAGRVERFVGVARSVTGLTETRSK
jgi:hypothetical protein